MSRWFNYYGYPGIHTVTIGKLWINLRTPRCELFFSEIYSPEADPPLFRVGKWRLRARRRLR